MARHRVEDAHTCTLIYISFVYIDEYTRMYTWVRARFCWYCPYHRLYTLHYILLIYVNGRVMRTLYKFQIVYRYSYTQRERERERERETDRQTHTGLLIGKILSTPSAAYLPATQSVHSEAPAVQAQRQTARSSRAFEIQKDAHSCVYTMHSSLCSP